MLLRQSEIFHFLSFSYLIAIIFVYGMRGYKSGKKYLIDGVCTLNHSK